MWKRRFQTRQNPGQWVYTRKNKQPSRIPHSKEANKSKNGEAYPPASNDTQVAVKNLPQNFTSSKLLNLFEKYGSISGHRIIMDHRISKCRGFGFVHFRNKNEAMAAVQGLHGKHRFPDGKLLLVSVMQKNVLFVKNLHTNVKWHQLFRLFATQGRVKYANVIIDERGIDRGYSSGMATVCFHKSEDAAKAIEAMNDIHIFGRRLCVEYFKTKYELRKEKFDYYKRGVPCIARKEVVHRTFVSIIDDAASVKETLVKRLCPVAKLFDIARWHEITLILLEFDNSELSVLLDNPHVLKRKMEDAASLIAIIEARYRI